MPLDATPGGANSNSYATVAEADAYHATHLYASNWTSASTANKEAALIWATRLLDQQVDWIGSKATEEQALRWPRVGAVDRDGYEFDSDVIPAFLKEATSELARHLLTEDRTEEQARGLRSVSAGSVQVEFDNQDKKPILPLAVRSMVDAFGRILGPASGMAKLERV